jgi:hypothetical protein
MSEFCRIFYRICTRPKVMCGGNLRKTYAWSQSADKFLEILCGGKLSNLMIFGSGIWHEFQGSFARTMLDPRIEAWVFSESAFPLSPSLDWFQFSSFNHQPFLYKWAWWAIVSKVGHRVVCFHLRASDRASPFGISKILSSRAGTSTIKQSGRAN